jgi:hypothetical protein
MSNPPSIRPQLSADGTAISKQSTTTLYPCEQQEKLVNLQGEIALLLAQIQSETKLVATR